MKLLLFATFLTLSMVTQAQSLFKPIPKPTKKYGVNWQNTTPLPDSTFTGFRFSGPMILYAAPNSTIFTGIGLSYEHDTYHVDNAKWYADWAVALGGYAGGQYAPNDISGVTAVGLSVSFFNKLLTLGVLYNLTTKKVQAGGGPAIPLNN